ncbi:MAG: hypothetical protein LLG06_08050 [Desulfobacteraceae bacterium]|nr:hypothetical protein [Desulfobacteraceae bacterium]
MESLDAMALPGFDPDAPQKQIYSVFKGADRIAFALKTLAEKLKALSEGHPEVEEVCAMARAIQYDFGRMLNVATRSTSVEGRVKALNVVKRFWRLNENSVSNEALHFLNVILGIPQTDIGILLGTSTANIGQRIDRYRTSLLPADINPDLMDEDDKAQLVMAKLYRVASSDKADRESINAARVFLELYNKQIERSSVEKWKQIEILADFFFSRLIPAMHQQLTLAGVKLDIRSICLPLFEEAGQELRTVVNKVKFVHTPKKKGRPKKNDTK